MDFDVKFCFDRHPPRMKEEVRTYALRVSSLLVQRIAFHSRELEVERLLPRHVRMIVFDITQDPVLRLNRGFVVVQNNKIRSMSKLLQRALDAANTAFERDPKHGLLDRALVRSCASTLEAHSIKASNAAVVYVATIVAEMIGILLSSAHMCMPENRTMTLENVKAMKYQLSTGQVVNNISVHRLMHSIERTSHMCQNAALEDEAITRVPAAKRPRADVPPCAPKSMRNLECKTVSFARSDEEQRPMSAAARPSTPTDCFWEEDAR